MNESTPKSAIPFAVTRKMKMVRQRKIWVQVASAFVAAAAVLLVAMAIAMLIDWLATLYNSGWRTVLTTTAMATAAVTIAGWLVIAWRRGLRWERVALDVDRQLPQLEERWTTMARLGPDVANPQVVHPAMLRRVATEAAGWEPHVNPQQVVSLSTLGRAMIGLSAITAVLAVAALLDFHRTTVLMRRFWLPGSSISATELVNMTGDVVVGRGESLELTAAVKGSPVDQAMLYMQSEANPEQTVTLVAHGENPIEFTHRIRAVDNPFTYLLRAGDGQTELFTVDVTDRPEIASLQMTVTPPAYTGRPTANFDKLPRRLTALEQSELQLAIRPTVSLKSLQLRMGDDQLVAMTADADGWYRWTTTLSESLSLSPLLTETHGLTNRRVSKVQINVVPDKAPIVKVISPDDQVAVRPDDTVEIKFTAQDDVGIGRAELVVYDESDPDVGPVELATISIPLDDQIGARRVDGTVNLDLSKYEIADGKIIGYEVRVSESRDAAINAAAKQQPEGRGPARGRGRNQTSMANATPQRSDPAKATDPAKPTDPTTAGNQGPQPNTTASTDEPAKARDTVAANNSETGNPSTPTQQPPKATPSTASNASNPTPAKATESTPSTNTVASNDNASTTPPKQNGASATPGTPTAENSTANQTAPKTDPMTPNNSAKNMVAANNANDPKATPSESPRTVASDRQSLTPSNASNANANANDMANASATASNSSQPSDSQNQTANNNSNPPSNSMAGQSQPSDPSSSGSSPPPNDMQKRSLDVGAQASSSQRMRLEVDEWAGSYDGQQRHKLEIAIAPELAALDAALARAQQTARTVLDEIEAAGEWRGKHDRDMTNTERSTVDAQQVIRGLGQKTHNTPYAFIGLQLTDIGNAHVNPARNNFWTALQSEGEARVASVRDGWQHVTRARELLADLSGQFQRAQKEFELAEKLQKIKKMYQVFIEDSFQLLNGQAGDPSRVSRTMAELKVDEEYLKRLREVLEMRRDMMAELARILAEDPRLLQRYMDLFKNRSTNLREQLADLTAEQQDLNREVRAWTLVDEAERPRIAQILLQRQLHDAADLATKAGTLQDRYQTWIPLSRQAKDADLQSATKLVQATATSANELSAKATAFVSEMQRIKVKPQAGAANAAAPAPADAAAAAAAPAAPEWDSNKAFADMRANADALNRRLTDLEVMLRQMGSREDDPEIAVFAANRLVEARRLIADTTAWIRQIDEHKAGNYARAAEVAQYRLAEQTDRLAGKLADVEQTLIGLLQRRDNKLPEPIAEKSREFITLLDKQAQPNQLAAVYALRRNQMPPATERQQAAHEALVAAEKAYDDMMRLAVTEMDKLPVQDPIASLLQDPTLDELLAALEQEAGLDELLGIGPRPTNLQQIGDWLRPGSGGGGSGAGFLGNQMRQRGERARRRIDRSYAEAIKRALKEQNERKAVAQPQPTMVINWNKLVSELGNDLQQGRDKAPPEQYRRAIEQYFHEISQAVAQKQEDQP
ncbi:MAG: hypothetical protein WD669_12025 [Pirellulales bacterium]